MTAPESGPDPPGEEKITFERALAELDRVVARLESGEAGLEEAVALFEEGQGYLKVCRERLGVAQKRIEELTAADLPPADSAAEDGEPF